MDKTLARSLHGSRLVRLINDLDLSDAESSGCRFAEKFSQLLHFSGAVNLSQVLKSPAAPRFARSDFTAVAIRDLFVSAQGDLVQSIAGSFTPAAAGSKDRLPSAEALHHHCGIAGAFPIRGRKKSKPHAALYEPYRQFYAGRQRVLEIQVLQLRSKIRDRVAGLSAELARLARVDDALAESLASASTDIFARIPLLLERRFSRSLENSWKVLPENPEPADLEPWMAPGGCITRFCGDMRALLFAELEIRLQPVAGLVEAAGAGSPG